MRLAHDKNKTYGCDDCSYLKGKRCQLWQIKIDDPHNSHCVSHDVKQNAKLEAVK